MKQMSRYRWDLIAPSGVLLVEGIYLPHRQAAEDWAKAYLSSWPTWKLKLVLMDKP